MSSYRQKAIATLSILSRPLLLLLAGMMTVSSRAAPSPGPLDPQKQTLRAFFDELGIDRMLRARFAQNPRAVLGEHGVDLPGFALPDCLTEGHVDQLLKQWPIVNSASRALRPAGPQVHDRADYVVAMQARPSPPALVYGPPAGLKRGPPAGLKRPDGTLDLPPRGKWSRKPPGDDVPSSGGPSSNAH